jgi:DNA-3-methyladenine glycosylase
VAHALVGARLVHVTQGGTRAGVVVETEAYEGPADAACHARFGKTRAREHLFARPGTSYVFLVYGMHHCFNVVAYREGEGHAVLIRAIEPEDPVARGDGPGRAAKVLGIDRAASGIDLVTSSSLWLEPSPSPREVHVSARVGVGYAGTDALRELRFFDPKSRSVSRPPRAQIGLGQDARKNPPGTVEKARARRSV